MDQEVEITKLLNEETIIEESIIKLKELRNCQKCSDLSGDINSLLDKLKDKKAWVKKLIDDLTEEVITAAEACAGIDDKRDFIEFF